MTANQLLTALFNAGIAISVGATVLSLGMSFTVGQLVAPLRRVWLVIAMVVLNALVIPTAAWGIAKASPTESELVPGLVLATLGAVSAASLKAAQLARRADLRVLDTRIGQGCATLAATLCTSNGAIAMPERDKHVIRHDRVEHYRARCSDRTVRLLRLTGGGRAERDREAGPANRQLCVHVDHA